MGVRTNAETVDTDGRGRTIESRNKTGTQRERRYSGLPGKKMEHASQEGMNIFSGRGNGTTTAQYRRTKDVPKMADGANSHSGTKNKRPVLVPVGNILKSP